MDFFLFGIHFSDEHCDIGMLSCEGMLGKSGILSLRSPRCSLGLVSW